MSLNEMKCHLTLRWLRIKLLWTTRLAICEIALTRRWRQWRTPSQASESSPRRHCHWPETQEQINLRKKIMKL